LVGTGFSVALVVFFVVVAFVVVALVVFLVKVVALVVVGVLVVTLAGPSVVVAPAVEGASGEAGCGSSRSRR